tara:strand:+ start:799 stop:1041 length:243 start_codon:yes stop_codon:yes gene_type:complete
MHLDHVTKTQRNALRELRSGTVLFGPGGDFRWETGNSLVTKGLAIVVEESAFKNSNNRLRPAIRCRITDLGKEMYRRMRR